MTPPGRGNDASIAEKLDHIAELIEDADHLVAGLINQFDVDVFESRRLVRAQERRDGKPVSRSVELVAFVRRMAEHERLADEWATIGRDTVSADEFVAHVRDRLKENS